MHRTRLGHGPTDRYSDDSGLGGGELRIEDTPGRGDASIVYVGLGANLGDREATLLHAAERLGALGMVKAVSPVYETAPVGFADQPAYLNAVASLRTQLEPDDLMSELLQIEHDLGRVRTFPNAPRTIDLDLLFYDDAVIVRPRLIVPHPRLHERAFVLMPLADIAPNLVHPHLGVSVGDLLQRVGSIAGMRRTDVSLGNVARET